MVCSSVVVRTACDIQVEGKQGPGRPKLTWKKTTAVRGSSQRLTHKKGAPEDLLCMQLALHINQKSDYDMMISSLNGQLNLSSDKLKINWTSFLNLSKTQDIEGDYLNPEFRNNPEN